MPGLFVDPLTRNEAQWNLGLDQFTSSTEDVLAATAGQAWTENAGPSLVRMGDRDRTNNQFNTDDLTGRQVPNPAYVPSEMLSDFEANEKYGIQANGRQVLGWTEPVRERVAQELNALKRDELLREDTIRRGRGGFWEGTLKFSTGLATSLVDPVNIMASFVPVVGEARWASILARAGESAISRGIARAGWGAVEGMAGAAMLEPVIIKSSIEEQRDHSAMDSILNIVMGGVLGGGLHVGFGAIGDKVNGISRVVNNAPIETREAMINEAITAVLEGRPVRSDLALREHLLSGTAIRSPYEQARLQFDSAVGPFRPSDAPGVDLGGWRAPTADAPHPAPDRSGIGLPRATGDDTVRFYQDQRAAEKAADRVEKTEGVRPEIVQTVDGYTMRVESKAEPVRTQDGSPMLFPNERAATKYADRMPSLADKDLAVIPVREGTGRVQYALLENATEREIAAARKAPGAVDLRQSRDTLSVIQDDAAKMAAHREQYLNDMSAYLERQSKPTPNVAKADLDNLAILDRRHVRARGEAEAIARDGGKTEATLIEKEISDLQAQVKAVEDVGELPAGAKEYLAEADAMVAQAEARRTMFERIAGCLR